MIITKEVIVTLNCSNISYYDKLGYFIPRVLNKRKNKMVTKHNTTIIVQLKDLQKQSNIKVEVQCDNPNCESNPRWIKYHDVPKTGKHFCFHCYCNFDEAKQKKVKNLKGKPLSKEHKRKLSENNWMKGRIGKLHPNWNNDLTTEERKRRRRMTPGLGQWQRLVLERDEHQCVCCSNKLKLCIHHKNNYKNFKEQRIDINNGATLCIDCHHLLHKIYGLLATKENFNDFMTKYHLA